MSSVRVYAEHSDLAFFLYERSLANKFYNAHLLARERNLTADVLMRHSQVSTGYWDVVQDTGADVVRVMMARCHDKAGDIYQARAVAMFHVAFRASEQSLPECLLGPRRGHDPRGSSASPNAGERPAALRTGARLSRRSCPHRVSELVPHGHRRGVEVPKAQQVIEMRLQAGSVATSDSAGFSGFKGSKQSLGNRHG